MTHEQFNALVAALIRKRAAALSADLCIPMRLAVEMTMERQRCYRGETLPERPE